MKKCPECPPHDQIPNRGTGLVTKSKVINICPTCNGGGVVDDDGYPVIAALSTDSIVRQIGGDPQGQNY